MKNRIINLIIQTIASLFSLWFVFVKKNSFILSILTQAGITSEKVQISFMASIALLVSGLVIILLDWLLTEVIFRPIKVKVGFRNELGNRNIKNIDIDCSKQSLADIQKKMKINVAISEGNWITNTILNLLGADLVIVYRPEFYETEITNGWISQQSISEDYVYQDKKMNTRVYWSNIMKNSRTIDDPIEINPQLIIKPKILDGHKCKVEIRLGTHFKKILILRFISKLFQHLLVKIDSDKLNITLKAGG